MIKLLFILLLFTSCEVLKYPQVSDGSKSDGTVTLMYEYTTYEKPLVQWEQAKINATDKCKAWGFNAAEFFEVGTTTCLQYSQYGCVRYKVEYKCQHLPK